MALGVSEGLLEKAYGDRVDLSGFYKNIDAFARQAALLEKNNKIQQAKLLQEHSKTLNSLNTGVRFADRGKIDEYTLQWKNNAMGAMNSRVNSAEHIDYSRKADEAMAKIHSLATLSKETAERIKPISGEYIKNHEEYEESAGAYLNGLDQRDSETIQKEGGVDVSGFVKKLDMTKMNSLIDADYNKALRKGGNEIKANDPSRPYIEIKEKYNTSTPEEIFGIAQKNLLQQDKNTLRYANKILADGGSDIDRVNIEFDALSKDKNALSRRGWTPEMMKIPPANTRLEQARDYIAKKQMLNISKMPPEIVERDNKVALMGLSDQLSRGRTRYGINARQAAKQKEEGIFNQTVIKLRESVLNGKYRKADEGLDKITKATGEMAYIVGFEGGGATRVSSNMKSQVSGLKKLGSILKENLYSDQGASTGAAAKKIPPYIEKMIAGTKIDGEETKVLLSDLGQLNSNFQSMEDLWKGVVLIGNNFEPLNNNRAILGLSSKFTGTASKAAKKDATSKEIYKQISEGDNGIDW